MRRGQQALEFIMTYGTTMMIVLGSMTALFMLDPLNITSNVGVQQCDFAGVIECDEQKAQFEDGELQLTLDNQKNTPLRITSMKFSLDGDTNLLEDGLEDGDLYVNDGEVEYLNLTKVFPTPPEFLDDPLYKRGDESMIPPNYSQVNPVVKVDDTWYLGQARSYPRYFCGNNPDSRTSRRLKDSTYEGLWGTMIHKANDLEPGKAPLVFVEDGYTEETSTGNQMTVNNLSYVEGKFDKALSFNEKGYATLPESFLDTKSYTVSFWINIQDTDEEYRTIMSRNASNIRHPGIWINQEGKTNLHLDPLKMNLTSGKPYGDTGTQLDLNKWYHVAIVMNESTRNFTMYLDGEKDYERNFNTSILPEPFPTPQGDILLGTRTGSSDQNASGVLLDELRLYDEALPQEAINGSGSLSQKAVHPNQNSLRHPSNDPNPALQAASETARVLMEPSDNDAERRTCTQGAMTQFTAHDNKLYNVDPYKAIQVLDISKEDVYDSPETRKITLSSITQARDIERMYDEWFVLDINADGNQNQDIHTESAIQVYNDDFSFNRTVELPPQVKNGKPWMIWKVNDDTMEFPIPNPSNASQVDVTRVDTDGNEIRTVTYHLPEPVYNEYSGKAFSGFSYQGSWYFNTKNKPKQFLKMPSLGCEQTKVFGPRTSTTFQCDLSDYISSLFNQPTRIQVDFRAYNPRVGSEYAEDHSGSILVK